MPVRVEVGPRDLAEGKVLSVRRDTFEKAPLDIEGLEGEIKAMLDAIQTNMFEIARAFRDEHTADVHSMEELEKQVNGGYAKAMWCGEQACEDEIKDRFGASSRCMPFEPDAHRRDLRLLRQAGQEGHLIREGILIVEGADGFAAPLFSKREARRQRVEENDVKRKAKLYGPLFCWRRCCVRWYLRRAR